MLMLDIYGGLGGVGGFSEDVSGEDRGSIDDDDQLHFLSRMKLIPESAEIGLATRDTLSRLSAATVAP